MIEEELVNLLINVLLKPFSQNELNTYLNAYSGLNSEVQGQLDRGEITAEEAEVKKTENQETILSSISGSFAAKIAEENLQYQRKYVATLTGGAFDWRKYIELNQDIKRSYFEQYNLYDIPLSQFNYDTGLEAFALKHYKLFGKNEGRLYTEQVPDDSEDAGSEDNNAGDTGGGSTGGGSYYFGGGYSSGGGSLDTSGYDALLAQLSSSISSLATSTQSTVTSDIDLAEPDTSEVLTEGVPFEFLRSNRLSRGLNPDIGFNQKKTQTYLQSILL